MLRFFNNTKAKKLFQLSVKKPNSFLFFFQISKRFISLQNCFLDVLFLKIIHLLKIISNQIKLLKNKWGMSKLIIYGGNKYI